MKGFTHRCASLHIICALHQHFAIIGFLRGFQCEQIRQCGKSLAKMVTTILLPLYVHICQCVFATTPIKKWSLFLHPLYLGLAMSVTVDSKTLANVRKAET